MQKRILLIGMLALTSGCSRDRTTELGQETPTSITAPATKAAGMETPCSKYSPFPDGIGLNVPFHLRTDRIYSTKAGAERRRVSLELLDGGAAAAASDIAGQMTASGFRALDVQDKGDGITRLAFLKKGSGRINVTASTDVGAKPNNPKAVGLITFDWQLAPAPGSPTTSANPATVQETKTDGTSTGG